MNQPPAVVTGRTVEVDGNMRFFQQAAEGRRSLCWVPTHLRPRVGDTLTLRELDPLRRPTGRKLHAVIYRVEKDVGKFVEVAFAQVTVRSPAESNSFD